VCLVVQVLVGLSVDSWSFVVFCGSLLLALLLILSHSAYFAQELIDAESLLSEAAHEGSDVDTDDDELIEHTAANATAGMDTETYKQGNYEADEDGDCMLPSSSA
jgi:hypothetical protein